MACLDNIIIRQKLTNGDTNLVGGYLYTNVIFEIEGADGYDIDGTVTFDYVRDLNATLSDPPTSFSQSIVSSGTTFGVYFYYPDTEPSTIITNGYFKIRIENCWYESTYTHILERNEKKKTSTKQSEVVGYEIISGCTNPLYFEYNPNANFDDGSCSILRPIYGCTNPLAINYNPNATHNDGSCTFTSGCTNPIADNYDESAVIDDGSCACGDVYLQMDFFDNSGESFVLTGDCTYYLEFDIITKIDCSKFIEYFENSDETVLDLLNKLQINLNVYSLADFSGNLYQYSGETVDITGTTEYINTQSENLFTFDISANPIGIGLIENEKNCDTLLQLIATELGLECQTLSKEIFNIQWNNHKIALNSDLIGSFSKFVLQFKEFKFGLCTYIDNVKFISVCNLSKQKCILIPKTFGYELGLTVDNKKSWVYSDNLNTRSYNDIQYRDTNYVESRSELTFNTKLIDLQVNTSKYIDNDVVKYFNNYENSFDDYNLKKLTIYKVENELIDVRNRQTIRSYPYQRAIYDWYSDGAQCAESKRLDYNYGFKLLSKLNSNWFAAVSQVIPLTTIWSKNEFVLKNTIFDKNKFRYKAYSLGLGSGDCATGVTLECNIITDKCFTGYTEIEEFLATGDSSLVCTFTGDTSTGFCTTISDDGSFGGKLVQFESLTYNGNEFYSVLDTWGFDEYYCVTGTPIPAPNTLSATLDYCCLDTESAKVELTISGGVPPYTIVGNFDGEIVPNGSIIQVNVTDSIGNNFSSENISVECFGLCPYAGSGDALFFGVVKTFGDTSTNIATINVRMFILESQLSPFGLVAGDAEFTITATNIATHTIVGGSPYQINVSPLHTTIPEAPSIGWYYDFNFDIDSSPNSLSMFMVKFEANIDIIGADCIMKLTTPNDEYQYYLINKPINDSIPQTILDIDDFGEVYYVFDSFESNLCSPSQPIDCETVGIGADITFDCMTDVYGYNTGLVKVNINPFGGVEPYTIVGLQDGDIVNSETEYLITIFDDNGCQSDDIYFLTPCPIPNCSNIDAKINSELKVIQKLSATFVKFQLDYNILDIPTVAVINSVDFGISIDAGQTYKFNPSNTTSITVSESNSSGSFIFNIDDFDPIILADFDFVVTLNLTIGENVCEFVATYNHTGSLPITAPPITLIDTKNNINFV